ncbi:31335_t:CDS:2, partial [Gigaspora margarita]
DRESQTSCNGQIVSIDSGGSGDFGRIFRLYKQYDIFKSDLATKKDAKNILVKRVIIVVLEIIEKELKDSLSFHAKSQLIEILMELEKLSLEILNRVRYPFEYLT